MTSRRVSVYGELREREDVREDTSTGEEEREWYNRDEPPVTKAVVIRWSVCVCVHMGGMPHLELCKP